jgi:3'-5' exoribonuclease
MVESRGWIAELRPGHEVDEAYVVRAKELRQRRGGGPFLVMKIGDRTGQVDALAWEQVEEIGRHAEVGNVIHVLGQVQRYNGRLQVVVRRAEPVPPDKINDDDFVRASEIDPDLLWSRLMALIEGVSDPHLSQLLFRIFSDPEIEPRFRLAPAARSMHHAFRSGLLEHTVSCCTAARALAKHYQADECLTVAGALLHDLGKIWELELGHSIEYTDDGRLIGHLPMEVIFIERKIKDLSSFPAETRRQLLHILLSHHGEYAYGSPRRPKTPEALLVHMVDNLDSKMAGMLEAINADGDSEEAWSAYSRILERHVYRRRPPTKSKA